MTERRKSPVDVSSTPAHMCTIDLRLEILSGLPFFKGLSAQDMQAVNLLFKETGYDAGDVVYGSDEPAEHLHAVADGKIRLLRHTLAGKNVLLDILGKGEFFGGLAGLGSDVYTETAQAHTPACVLRIHKDAFRKILEQHPGVTLKLLEAQSQRLNAAHEMVSQLSVHSVEQRIAHLLLRLARKFGQPSEVGRLIQAPLSREDLAEMTGTTTESASRVISQWQKAGWIETGRQWIAVKENEKLKEILESIS